MMVSVQHSTVYRYPHAVQLEPHTFRLRPRMTTTQRLLAFHIQILPEPTGLTECMDQDGNLTLRTWFDIPTAQLSVRSQFTVELIRHNPFDFLLSDESQSLDLWYPDPLAAALAPYREHGQVAEAVKQYAKSVAHKAQWNTLSFLTALCQHIFSTFRHSIRSDGAPWISDDTLRHMQGSCRDLAVLFCDCCRVVGFAARFVSGYECASAGRTDSYMHAWAEVYLPGAGWRGYDPSRGTAVADNHIAVAAAFDSALASPVMGTYFGGSESSMETSLWLQVLTHEPGAPA